jgi:DNA-binding NarL/FixJ family response regulator
MSPFTPQEEAVLRLVIDGVGRAAIARKLGLVPGTVSVHFDHLKQKLPGNRPLYQRAALWAAGCPEPYLYIAQP